MIGSSLVCMTHKESKWKEIKYKQYMKACREEKERKRKDKNKMLEPERTKTNKTDKNM
jgi:hypothetical protein